MALEIGILRFCEAENIHTFISINMRSTIVAKWETSFVHGVGDQYCLTICFAVQVICPSENHVYAISKAAIHPCGQNKDIREYSLAIVLPGEKGGLCKVS